MCYILECIRFITHNAIHSPQRQHHQQESATRDQQETKTLQLNIHRYTHTHFRNTHRYTPLYINVTKNLLTGESKVLSTATIPADELHQHTGLKVYDDGRKCVYHSHDRSCASELSANEVEQLLRSATMHRKENHQNYCEPRSTRKELPSPLFEDNAPYTILNAVNTTEPITAIFMGFQMAQDDRGLGHEFEGSLKAELVLIEDNEDVGEDNNTKENNNAGPTAANNYQNERSTNGNMKHTPRPVGPGIRKIQKKHRHCCTVC
uniref:Palmdelphin n=1 Tax=Labrus bergylta TaxID=56723 RepID=A0A3Q3F324_9LABR